MKVTGTITKMFAIEIGKTKEEKDWAKVSFLVETSEEYNNLYCFEMFGMGDSIEKVENLIKYNKEGDSVSVEFNVKTSEWKGKFYTSLSAWLVKKDDGTMKLVADDNDTPAEDDDLPF